MSLFVSRPFLTAVLHVLKTSPTCACNRRIFNCFQTLDFDPSATPSFRAAYSLFQKQGGYTPSVPKRNSLCVALRPSRIRYREQEEPFDVRHS